MESKRVEEAVNYGVSSNKLEDNNLTSEEVDKIIDDINKSDESFLNELVGYINNEKKEEVNVKVRK